MIGGDQARNIKIILESPGLESLVIGCGATIGIRQIDLGYPAARVVAQAATGQDGAIDDTSHFGSRTISANLYAKRATFAEMQLLRAYLNPGRRSTITFEDLPGGAPPIQADVRGSALAATLAAQELRNGGESVTVQWNAPAGILESVELHQAVLVPGGTGIVPGRTYPLTFDRSYPAAPVDGAITITNSGGATAYPVINIYGPITAPEIINLTTGAQFSFPDLTIDAGSFLEIDARAQTIRYNADPLDSRRRFLDFASSSWWGIDGSQLVRMLGTGTGATTQAPVLWRDAYL